MTSPISASMDVCASLAHDDVASSYYKRRYHNDPAFREKERARTVEKVRANYTRYQELWRQAYLRKKAAKQAAATAGANATVQAVRHN
jgi:hypothetical protein